MCGIVGVIGRAVNANHVKWLRQAVAVDTFRGEHSTGIARIDSKELETNIVKLPVPGFQFFEYKQADTLVNRVGNCSGFIAHNRFATTGRISAANAHPFRYDHITLVHNGTLFNWNELNKDVAVGTFDVDSEALTYCVADQGYEAAFKKAQGAYATVWYDANEDAVKMLRNEQRPLYYARDKKTAGIVYFASEAWMISALCERNDLEVEEPALLPVMELHEFDLSVNDTPMTVTKVEGYVYPKQTPSTTGGHSRTGNTQTSRPFNKKFPTKNDFSQIMEAYDVQEEDVVAVWVGGWLAYSRDQKNGMGFGWLQKDRDVIDTRIYNMPRWFAKIISVDDNEDPADVAKSGGDWVFCKVKRVGYDNSAKDYFIGLEWLDQRSVEVQVARSKDPTFAKMVN